MLALVLSLLLLPPARVGEGLAPAGENYLAKPKASRHRTSPSTRRKDDGNKRPEPPLWWARAEGSYAFGSDYPSVGWGAIGIERAFYVYPKGLPVQIMSLKCLVTRGLGSTRAHDDEDYSYSIYSAGCGIMLFAPPSLLLRWKGNPYFEFSPFLESDMGMLMVKEEDSQEVPPASAPFVDLSIGLRFAAYGVTSLGRAGLAIDVGIGGFEGLLDRDDPRSVSGMWFWTALSVSTW